MKKNRRNFRGSTHGSPSRVSINNRNIVFGFLEDGTRAADVAHRFGYNDSTIYRLQAQTGSEKDSPRSRRPWITTPREDSFIVTSS